MGVCWSTRLPEEEEDSSTTQSPKCLANNRKTARKVVEFGREEVKLNELLASLRTGLVFAPTEFSVLPGGLSTTAKLTFEVGNSELQRRQEAVHESLHSIRKASESREGNETAGDEDGIQSSPDPQPFKLNVTLEGHGWAKKLVMTLCVQPVVGAFAGRTLQFLWRDDALQVLGSEQGELEAHSLPLSFENEVEFCTCCLQLIYQSKQLVHEDVDENSKDHTLAVTDTDVPSLKYSAYRTLVSNLDVVTDKLHVIPARLYHILFGSHDPVNISITLWPKSYKPDDVFTLKVKSGILFAELVHLIQGRLHCKSNLVLKLYNNFRPINATEIVLKEFKQLDCFVVTRDSAVALINSFDGSNFSFPTEELILSLVGKEIQSIEADLEMPMEEFDTMVRNKFKLRENSFLIILAEDDLAPQYMADDNWKCTYTFSIPDNSFSAGLRRSLRRLSTRRRGSEGRPTTPSSEANTASTFAPQMAEVIELLSSNERRFPRNSIKCGLVTTELYQSMPIYRMSIEQCGIHQHSMILVFEVTGPSIPITVRIVSDYTNNDSAQHGPSAPRTRLANIMDINPDWSVNTFLQYIDAVVSPSSSSRQRKLWLKDRSVDYKTDDLSKLTLGALLDSWKPLWWAEGGSSRRQLTTKDIDPSEYLIVEKF